MRRRLVKSFVLLQICAFFCHSTFASDIVSDSSENGIIVKDAKLSLSSAGKRKASALYHYANSFISSRKTDGKVNSDTINDLIETLVNDPNASRALTLILRTWNREDKLVKSAYRLISIAEAHPEVIRINLVCASILIKKEKYQDAKKLLEACYNRYNDMGYYDSQFVKLIIPLLTLCEKCRSFEKGEEIIDFVIGNKNYSDNILLLASSIDLLSQAVIYTPENSFRWFGHSKLEYAEKRDKLLGMVNSICFEAYHPIEELLPILEIYKEEGLQNSGANLLMSNFLGKPDDVATQIILADYLYNIKEYRESLRLWKRIISNTKAPNRDLKFSLGKAAYMVAEYKFSEEVFESILALYDNDDRESIYYLGLIHFDQGLFLKAINKVKSIIDIPWGAYLTASCFKSLKQFDKAAVFMFKAEEMAIKTRDNEFLTKEFYLNFASILEYTGDYKTQKKFLMRLYKQYPEDSNVLNYLGYIMAEHDDELDKAEELIKLAIEKEPENIGYLDSMAWVLYKKEMFQDALGYIKECILKEDGLLDAVISDHAGDIYYAVGDIKKAVKYWELALETYSEDTDADKILTKLKSATK